MPRRHPPHGPIVFDCDGLLVATQGVWDNAYAALCDRHGVTLTRADRRRLVGLGLRDLGHELARILDLPGQHQRLSIEIHDLVASNFGCAITPMPGAVELVTALNGHRPLAVASNTLTTVVVEYLTVVFTGRFWPHHSRKSWTQWPRCMCMH